MVWFESDARAIARAVNLACGVEEIDHGTARAVASGYNKPGIVAQFVTTGAIRPDATTLWRAVTDDCRLYQSATREERAALDALGTYLLHREHEDGGRAVPGWAQMWVIKHADYPHAGDGDLWGCPACEAVMDERGPQRPDDSC